MSNFNSDADVLRKLIKQMRLAYKHGQNVMACAREILGKSDNSLTSTLIAYDLQAGSYISHAQKNPDIKELWCEQIASIISPLVGDLEGYSLLEVGCGEATTLRGVLEKLSHVPVQSLGFDLSWSRVAYGLKYIKEKQIPAFLFVADLFKIPLEDNSIDVVYTSHSLEPNGGREEDAIAELLRVARHAVVMVEPGYELASSEARARMRYHGYVRGLKDTAVRLGAVVQDYRLLEYAGNPLNPSGLLVLQKPGSSGHQSITFNSSVAWSCPLTRAKLDDAGDVFQSGDTGLVYPVLRDIPMLRPQHAIVASAIVDGIAF